MSGGWNPADALNWAVTGGSAKIVKQLTEKNIKLDQVSKKGYTALMHAAESGKYDIAKEILRAMAIDNHGDKMKHKWYQNDKGENALKIAIKLGQVIY